MPDGKYCLGGNFPVGYNDEERCWVYTSSTKSVVASDNTQLMEELSSVANISDGERSTVQDNVGPWVEFMTDGNGRVVRIMNIISGTDSSQCPSQAPASYNGGGVIVCRALLY